MCICSVLSQIVHAEHARKGTLVSYEAFFEAIEERLGQRLRANNIGSRIFAYGWMEATEKEYTYLSMSKGYVKVFDIFGPLFYRTLGQAGIKEPRAFASDEDLQFLLTSYRNLKLRPGVHECFKRLREGGYTVWCFTSGDTKRVSAYLSNGGVDFPSENLVSCDTVGIGKPAPESYQYVLDKFGKGNLEAWFAAGHMWDVSAARRFG